MNPVFHEWFLLMMNSYYILWNNIVAYESMLYLINWILNNKESYEYFTQFRMSYRIILHPMNPYFCFKDLFCDLWTHIAFSWETMFYPENVYCVLGKKTAFWTSRCGWKVPMNKGPFLPYVLLSIFWSIHPPIHPSFRQFSGNWLISFFWNFVRC